jgi:hypothetical protein
VALSLFEHHKQENRHNPSQDFTTSNSNFSNLKLPHNKRIYGHVKKPRNHYCFPTTICLTFRNATKPWIEKGSKALFQKIYKINVFWIC